MARNKSGVWWIKSHLMVSRLNGELNTGLNNKPLQTDGVSKQQIHIHNSVCHFASFSLLTILKKSSLPKYILFTLSQRAVCQLLLRSSFDVQPSIIFVEKQENRDVGRQAAAAARAREELPPGARRRARPRRNRMDNRDEGSGNYWH